MGKIERITLNLFNEPRMIRIYLPDDLSIAYPVLYMHDGHNLFDVKASYGGVIWNVHETLSKIEAELNKSFIVVGIDCHSLNRLDEYSPWINYDLLRLFPEGQVSKAGGLGNEYLKWIVEELKPYIDNHYPTLIDESYLAGSSMGGFISLYGGYLYPDVFKGVGCFSSAFWFEKPKMIDFIKNYHNPNLIIYLDVGTNESDNDKMSSIYLNDTIEIADLIKSFGTKHLKLLIDEGAQHHELAWQKRFPNFVKWLIKTKN